MKNFNIKKTALLFTFNFLLLTAFAQTPNAFKYQTVVRDASGNAMISANVDFQISVLETTAIGSSVYVETFSETTNTFGLVNLEIGNGTLVSGDFATINWSGDLHFVKIEVDINDGNGLQEMGTSQLLSVPYALNAKSVDNTDDADADSTNEIQDLNLAGNILTITNSASPTNIDLSGYSNLWQENVNGNDIYYNNGYVGIGVVDPNGKLIVQGDNTSHIDSAIFEVKNQNGRTVFAVYEEGVRVYVDDNGTKANSSKGGFAIGGFSAAKGLTNEYFRVTPDSIRGYIESNSSKGGFAIGGFTAAKTFTHEYLRVTDDSTRIWTEDSIAGFGIRNLGNSSVTSYMDLTPNNYFIGHLAGDSITTGLYNSFIGYESGRNNTTGDDNIFLGYNSGFNNVGGWNNIFIGNSSGFNNDWGQSNVFVGYSAGYYNINASNCTFVGAKSGYDNNAGQNSFFGYLSGTNNTTGSGNTFLGSNAGMNNVSGSNNVYIGNTTGLLATGNNNIFIGSAAGYNETGDDKLYIDNSDTSTPLIGGDFSSNKVGINRMPTVYTLEVGGTIWANGATISNGSTTWSDARYKTNINTLNNSLDKLCGLRGVTYDWRYSDFPNKNFPNGLQIGVIAQEVEKIFPELINTDKDGFKSVSYEKFTPILIEAVKEQQKTIEELKLINKQIINSNENLKARIEKLEK